MLKTLSRYWPVIALASSAALLAAAHYFEAQGYAPCNLCLKQRAVHWAVIAAAVAALAVGRTPFGARSARAFGILLAVLFLASAAVAFFHVGVEFKWWPGPDTCAATGTATAASLDALLRGAEIKPPSCDEAVWFFLGLSMAFWNGLASLALAAFGLFAARARR